MKADEITIMEEYALGLCERFPEATCSWKVDGSDSSISYWVEFNDGKIYEGLGFMTETDEYNLDLLAVRSTPLGVDGGGHGVMRRVFEWDREFWPAHGVYRIEVESVNPITTYLFLSVFGPEARVTRFCGHGGPEIADQSLKEKWISKTELVDMSIEQYDMLFYAF